MGYDESRKIYSSKSTTPILDEYDYYLGNATYVDAFFKKVGIRKKFGSLFCYITDFCTDNYDNCGACPGYHWSTNKSSAKTVYKRKDLGLTFYCFESPHSGGLVLKTPKAIELMSQIMKAEMANDKAIKNIEWQNVTQINLVWDT